MHELRRPEPLWRRSSLAVLGFERWRCLKKRQSTLSNSRWTFAPPRCRQLAGCKPYCDLRVDLAAMVGPQSKLEILPRGDAEHFANRLAGLPLGSL